MYMQFLYFFFRIMVLQIYILQIHYYKKNIILFINMSFNMRVKPYSSRPDSAKTLETRMTTQTEVNSIFSETDSMVSKKMLSKTNDFATHVEELNKKPKFKRFVEALPPIQQKKEIEQLKKINSRPFQVQNPNNKKIAEKLILTNKNQIQDSLKFSKISEISSSFMQKNKKKLNQITSNSKKSEKKQQRKQEQVNNIKINLSGFVYNDPLKKKQKNPPKKQSEIQQSRRDQLLKLSEYVNQRQLKNYQLYPIGYQNMIEQAQKRIKTGHREQIQQINIEEFRNDFNENNFNSVFRKIKELDQELDHFEKGGDKNKNILNEQQKDQEKLFQLSSDSNLDLLSESSLSSLKIRNNLFLTEILKGNLCKQNLKKLQNIENSYLKQIKLEKRHDQYQQEQISPKKKGLKNNMNNNLFIQKNKIQASGGFYRQCDYLPQQQKQRLDQLMKEIENGILTAQNPFNLDKQLDQHLKRIDQGIQVYKSLFNFKFENYPVISETNLLPKDPTLRRQTELKILKQKIKSINSQLINVNRLTIDKSQIEKFLKQISEMNIQQPKSSLIELKRKEFEEFSDQMSQAQQFLNKNCEQQHQLQVQSFLNEIKLKFEQLQQQIDAIQNLSNDELKEFQRRELNETRESVKQIEKQTQNLSYEIQNLQNFAANLKNKINQMNQLEDDLIITQKIICKDFNNVQETIQGLDKLITRKYQQSQNKSQVSQ